MHFSSHRVRRNWSNLFAVFIGLQTAGLLAALVLMPGIPRVVSDPQTSNYSSKAGLPKPVPPFRHVTYEISEGDTLFSIWKKVGAPARGAQLAAKIAAGTAQGLQLLRPRRNLDIILSGDGDLTELICNLEDGSTISLSGDVQRGYELVSLPADVIENPREVAGIVQSSLLDAAAQQLIPRQVLDEFVDLFSSRFEFTQEQQAGCTYTVKYLERISRRSGAGLTPGPIISASFGTGGALMSAVRFSGRDGQARYYDEQGRDIERYFLRYPLKFTHITSAFSEERFHPLLKERRPHHGVDLAAPSGTPVRAIADGVVVDIGFQGEAGVMLKLSHANNYASSYLHLSRLAPGLKRGLRVRRGEILGNVGSTGLSTGPHLHYSLLSNNLYVDPLYAELPMMPGNFEPISESALVAALAELRFVQAALRIRASASLPALLE
jgi:murein DD-endopeptidase MepM/ murein hydrolase activator NlpD